MPFGLYIHIPYCLSRCRYCDFYTQPACRAVPDAYISALLRDIFRWMPKGEGGAPLNPDTVYFGGGTPGLLSVGQVKLLLQAANPKPGAEITLEANPAADLAEKLAGWREAGVNRLSLGVQTAQKDSLRRLGRPHTAAQAASALKAARAAGFENISGDIMLALPGYTFAEFDGTLELLMENNVAHVSAYLLKIEPGTAFWKSPPPGLPGPDEAAEFYLYAVERLSQAGFSRYEISNFAKPGFEGRHNLIYWDCGDWLGLGPSAHSCLKGRRFSFAEDTVGYIAGGPGLGGVGGPAPQEEGTLTAQDYIMLRLRLDAGFSEKMLKRRFSVALGERQRQLLWRLCEEGLARRTPEGWALTSRGMLVQNAILSRLLP